ncbi:hypothetical protein [Maridesulfovibrio ferrireducens]|uniref:hypothetical protein n=1 Tax=Maridesulfovibrio ferrireducens TaxID=246191 RepID=UPI001A232931|nr:hypothetical protein [Maridesulfovibrio ferrireducens]MBI9111298.1 hypothetical protein [Maridesulfovibrio ferrireducens]
MTNNLNSRRKRQAITNRQLHVVLSMVGTGLELMDESFCKSARGRSSLEKIHKWCFEARDRLDTISSTRANKAVSMSFRQVRDTVEVMFPDGEFGAEDWMHYWLAVHMLVCDALITKLQKGGKKPWHYLEMSTLSLIKDLAGDKEHELYECGDVADTEPLLGTVVGMALTDIVWSE